MNTSLFCKITKYIYVIIIITSINFSLQVLGQERSCKEKEKVCEWLKKVVAIKTPTMIASGIFLSDSIIVTNRHVVEDSKAVLVRMPNKKIIKAFTIPNNHSADIAFISLTKNIQSIKFDFDHSQPNKTRMIAFDIGRNDIRIFPETNIISYPEPNKPQARIHSSARNLPGSSGGALIDKNGNLIGIIASGGGEYNEAVPVNLLKDVYNQNNIENEKFFQTGKAIRLCADALEEAQQYHNKPEKVLLRKIQTNCELSNNKLLLDMAGQAFGRFGLINDSIYFLEKSTKLDPKSPTSLHSLAVALHLNKSYEKEIPILKTLLEFTPEDPQALRLAVQAAAFSKNKDFGEYAISLMEIHNPSAVPLARGFLDNAFD